MDLNDKNGQPSMEEILASIRRIIAEEPTAANPVIDLHAKYKAKDPEDSNDFELPSIFRPAPSAPERQPLFGRLTDAIRNASGGTVPEGKSDERYRGGLRDASGAMAPGNDAASVSSNGESERYRGALRDSAGASPMSGALSSLKLTRGDTFGEQQKEPTSPTVVPAPPPAAPVVAAPAPAPVAPPTNVTSAPVEDVRRVMVPFRDQKMSRMSFASLASETYVPPTETVMPAAEPPQAAPTPASFSNPDYPRESLSLEDMHRYAPVFGPPPVPAPAPAAAAESSGSGIEDATADLLRPMLRQWLSENMPRMVEKALSIELAESVRVSRKLTGQ